MASKYLDNAGLTYFWGKLKAYFQPKLVSGTNIKTVNNQSLLGSGNITIEGGSASGTATPTANTISKFDSSAKMNSTDMTAAQVKTFIDDLDYTPAVVNDTVPIGAIQAFGGTTAPKNWLICDGSAVSRTTYAKLFSVIGTTYGTGNGSTTFNLPDLKGRVAVGAGNSGATGATNHTLGQKSGEETHTLTTNEMPSHVHYDGTSGSIAYAGTAGLNTAQVAFDASAGRSTTATGGGAAHNNMQPYVVTNYIIKYNDKEVSGNQMVSTIDFFYPVGSYYETSDASFDPNVSWHGTWMLEEQGRVHVSSGTNYTVGAKGGASSVKLSASIGAVNSNTGAIGYVAEGANAYQGTHNANLAPVGTGTVNFSVWNHSVPVTEYNSTDRNTSIMQPYIVVNRWHRTA